MPHAATRRTPVPLLSWIVEVYFIIIISVSFCAIHCKLPGSGWGQTPTFAVGMFCAGTGTHAVTSA